MDELLLSATDRGMTLRLLLQLFFYELKEPKYVARLQVYWEKKTWETEAMQERAAPKKISAT
jgi:hypothetical protein